MGGEHFFIQHNTGKRWREASENETRERYTNTYTYVGLEDDSLPGSSITFARTTSGRTRLVVNFAAPSVIAIDPTPDLSYDFLVKTANWETALGFARNELRMHEHRPPSQQINQTLGSRVSAAVQAELLLHLPLPRKTE